MPFSFAQFVTWLIVGLLGGTAAGMVVKRHRKPNAQSRTGQIVEKPMPIHISNVMLADPKDGKPTRIKMVRNDEGVHRVAIKSGQQLK